MKNDMLAIFNEALSRLPNPSGRGAKAAEDRRREARDLAEWIIYKAVKIERQLDAVATKSMSYSKFLLLAGRGVQSQEEYETLYIAIKRLYRIGEFGAQNTIGEMAELRASDALDLLNQYARPNIMKMENQRLESDLRKINGRGKHALGTTANIFHKPQVIPIGLAKASFADVPALPSKIIRDYDKKESFTISLGNGKAIADWASLYKKVSPAITKDTAREFDESIYVGKSHFFASDAYRIFALQHEGLYSDAERRLIEKSRTKLIRFRINRESANKAAIEQEDALLDIYNFLPLTWSYQFGIPSDLLFWLVNTASLYVGLGKSQISLSYQDKDGSTALLGVNIKMLAEAFDFLDFPKDAPVYISVNDVGRAFYISKTREIHNGSYVLQMPLMNSYALNSSINEDKGIVCADNDFGYELRGQFMLDAGYDYRGSNVMIDGRRFTSPKKSAFADAVGRASRMADKWSPYHLFLSNGTAMLSWIWPGGIIHALWPHDSDNTGSYEMRKSLYGDWAMLRSGEHRNSADKLSFSKNTAAIKIPAQMIDRLIKAVNSIGKGVENSPVLVDNGDSLFLTYYDLKETANYIVKYAASSGSQSIFIFEKDKKGELLAALNLAKAYADALGAGEVCYISLGKAYLDNGILSIDNTMSLSVGAFLLHFRIRTEQSMQWFNFERVESNLLKSKNATWIDISGEKGDSKIWQAEHEAIKTFYKLSHTGIEQEINEPANSSKAKAMGNTNELQLTLYGYGSGNTQPALFGLPALHACQCEEMGIQEDESLSGAQEIYERVNSTILSIMERDGLFWRRPWGRPNPQGMNAWPTSYPSDYAYTGINSLVLASEQIEKEYSSPYWVTLKKANELGGTIRKGEKSTEVIFWKMLVKDAKGNILPITMKEMHERQRRGEKLSTIPMLKSYRVFNTDQTQGITIPHARIEAKPELPRIWIAEAAWQGFPDKPKVHNANSARAFYRPGDDSVTMPYRSMFKSPEGYYQVLFHELTHAMGASHRLNRVKGKAFGDTKYAFEELVAELGAAYMMAWCGLILDNSVLDNSAAYIKGWKEAIQEELKQDKAWLFRASSDAGKAMELMLGPRLKDPSMHLAEAEGLEWEEKSSGTAAQLGNPVISMAVRAMLADIAADQTGRLAKELAARYQKWKEGKSKGLSGWDVDGYYFDYIPKADPSVYGGENDVKVLIPIIKSWIMANLKGKSFINASTGWTIGINDNAIGKWFSQHLGSLKLKAYTVLPSIIEVGVHIGEEADKHGNRNVKRVHKFFSIVEIDGKAYPFGFLVDETTDGHFIYNTIFINTQKNPTPRA